MSLCVVRDVVSHAGAQNDHPAVFQFRVQFTSIAQQQVTFVAPVIGTVAGGILHHADANVAKLTGAPYRLPSFARVIHAGDALPIDCLEGNIRQLHLGYRRRLTVENLEEPRVLDVAAAEHHSDILIGHGVALLE
jgi:hypothetical protein